MGWNGDCSVEGCRREDNGSGTCSRHARSGGGSVSDQTPTGPAPNGAVISGCGRYRYLLWRRASEMWASDRRMLFIMLNPSTADAYEDDPTIRRCIGYARRENCGWLDVVNLYALRSTDWSGLNGSTEPLGIDNPKHVRNAMEIADLIVAAWGSHWRKVRTRPVDVEAIARAIDKPLHCLKVTKQGDPGHPLYLRADAPLLPFGRSL